jgi:hypothetical protein
MLVLGNKVITDYHDIPIYLIPFVPQAAKIESKDVGT